MEAGIDQGVAVGLRVADKQQMHSGEVGFSGDVREPLHQLEQGTAVLVFERLGAYGIVVGYHIAGGILRGVRDALRTGVEGSGRVARANSTNLGHVGGTNGLGQGEILG